jgi:HK97 family phage prohead protease
MAVDLKPTEAMAEEAQRGLDWRAEYNRGGTAVGVARARDISNRVNLSPRTVRRMVSYFARHEVDKEGEGWSPGENGYPSAGRIAWALWGGNPGKSWANARSRELEAEGRSMDIHVTKDMPLSECDFKFRTMDGAFQFEGYASVWGRVDSYGDTVLKGAFAESLEKERMPLMLYGHNANRVIGKWVKMAEDDRGLYVVGELTPGHSEAKDIEALMKHGAISGLSIGGYTTDAEDKADRGKIIKAFDLFEVSLVSMPAEDEARIDPASFKSRLNEADTIKDIEALLREAGGFSRSNATAIVAKLRAIFQRDADNKGKEKDELAALAEFIRSNKLKGK